MDISTDVQGDSKASKASKAHVICCNDSIELVVIDNVELADRRLKELRDAYYERSRWNWQNREHYECVCYWHIHVVDAET